MPEVTVDKLRPGMRSISLKVKVVDKAATRDVTSRRDGTSYRVADAVVGDTTGCVTLPLWNESIDSLQPGDVVQIENGYTSVFRNSLQLNIGRYGKVTKLQEDIQANTGNNISEKETSESG